MLGLPRMEPKPSEATEAQPTQAPAKPAKEKKPRSEAQQAATAKALAAMSAKRKEILAEHKEKKEKAKIAKKVVEDKILKEDLAFATRNDVDSLRKELAEVRALYATAQQQHREAKPEPTKERVVERIIERQPPTLPAQPTKLTGHALLDKLFFEK